MSRQSIFLIVVSLFLGSSIPASAQTALALSSSPRDVVYLPYVASIVDKHESEILPISSLPPYRPGSGRYPPYFAPYGGSTSSLGLLGKIGILPVKKAEERKFRWIPALKESLLYTGVMHGFDVTTEAGTRDALNGHWFQHYLQSVLELRGWSDGDTFMAPYLGHPLEGSIFGFIERQNDPA